MQVSEDLKLIFSAIASGKCLPFLGAGASTNYQNHLGMDIEGLPTGNGLAEILLQRCEYRNSGARDLLTVAEYFVYSRNGDREELQRVVQEAIQTGCAPRPIHTVLAQLLPIKIVLSSNYDTLMEQELNRYQRLINRHVYNPHDSRTGHFEGEVFLQERDVIFHKMHGSIDQPESLIITRSDYIRYLTRLNDMDRGMPAYFRKIVIPQFTLLFLGYGMDDWNFQVIWEGVLADYADRGVRRISYAIVKNPSHFQRRFWLTRNVILLDMDLTDFSMILATHFNLEIPQMGILKHENKTK